MRAVELTEARPELAAAVEPLLKAREPVEKQIADLDRKVMQLARNDVQVRRFMTAPGSFSIKLADGLLLDVPAKEPRDEILGKGRRWGRPKRRAPQGAKLIEAERPHAVNLSLDSLAIKC
ncbi:MAG: hypothetical protein WA231_01710 [Methylocella sp.]